MRKKHSACVGYRAYFSRLKGIRCAARSEFSQRDSRSPLNPSLNLLSLEEVMPFADRDVQCVSCGVMFVFSAGEQQFFKEKGFLNLPKHCKQCKATREGATARRRIETPVTCSDCGGDTTVPFKPTQGRPVLCRVCFTNGRKTSGIVAANEKAASFDLPLSRPTHSRNARKAGAYGSAQRHS